MLFDLESELPDAGAPADDVEMAAADTPIEISSRISSPPKREKDEEPDNQRRTPPYRRNTLCIRGVFEWIAPMWSSSGVEWPCAGNLEHHGVCDLAPNRVLPQFDGFFRHI